MRTSIFPRQVLQHWDRTPERVAWGWSWPQCLEHRRSCPAGAAETSCPSSVLPCPPLTGLPEDAG